MKYDYAKIFAFEEALETYSVEELEKIAAQTNEQDLVIQPEADYEERIIAILNVRKRKLNNKFRWTATNKEKLLHLNDKLIDCFEKLKAEAMIVFQTTQKRIDAKDDFMHDFEIEANVRPSFYEEKDGGCYEKEDGIEAVLVNYWDDWYMKFYIHSADFFNNILYLDRKQNWNIDPWFKGKFDDCFISQGIHDLYDHAEGWSFPDILKINHLRAELHVIYQHSTNI